MASKKVTEAAKRANEMLSELRLRETGAIGRKLSSKALPKAALEAAKNRIYADKDTDSLIRALRADQKVVYGVDDRVDVHQVTDPDVQRNVMSVVSLIDVSNIIDNGDGTSTIRTVRFGDAQRLCSSERFVNQPTAPFCSGFLVAANLVATAGHCVDNNDLGRARFVFGYEINNFADGTIRLPNTEVFLGEAIVGRELASDGADYAVVRLDRPAVGKPITKLRRNGKISNDQPVYVIGHPSGLPKKYAPEAVVRANDEDDFFVANLDTYGGNSGSPVFNEDDHTVEGILVRGETDFIQTGSCRVSNVCPTTGCRGEDVTRSAVFAEFVPESADGGEELPLENRVAQLENSISELATAIKNIEDRLE
ncbi:MAG: trypsin-like serine peptidase [Rhizobiaceae bacterium]